MQIDSQNKLGTTACHSSVGPAHANHVTISIVWRHDSGISSVRSFVPSSKCVHVRYLSACRFLQSNSLYCRLFAPGSNSLFALKIGSRQSRRQFSHLVVDNNYNGTHNRCPPRHQDENTPGPRRQESDLLCAICFRRKLVATTRVKQCCCGEHSGVWLRNDNARTHPDERTTK